MSKNNVFFGMISRLLFIDWTLCVYRDPSQVVFPCSFFECDLCQLMVSDLFL